MMINDRTNIQQSDSQKGFTSTSFPNCTALTFHHASNRSEKLRHHRINFLLFALLAGSFLSLLPAVSASIACKSHSDCEATLREGSQCLDGTCTNPYAYGGCLRNVLGEDHYKIRTCNSEDPQDLVDSNENNFCRPSDLDYLEVRIASQNWEGAFFVTWVMQILLSELLDVPVSVETGTPGKRVNFYDLHSSMDYGVSDNYEGFRTADRIGDCRDVLQNNQEEDLSPENYQPCHHVTPEIWSGKLPVLAKYEDVTEPPISLGALGSEGWYIPQFTAKNDPTLLHHLGLSGEVNRKKLAETFLRPASWKEYCQEESQFGCEIPDETAARPPESEAEENSYFREGLYNGFFRKTEQNDCEKHNTTCTGHFVDYPCGWISFFKANAYHLNIALQSDGPEGIAKGYSYSQMTQIWAAANATKSNVIMQWWEPEALKQKFAKTDAEFYRVTLPSPTQSCINNRIPVEARCGSTNLTEQVGSPMGACDETPHILRKALSKNLFELTQGSNIPHALHSPAYAAIKDFSISELQVAEIFDAWLAKGRDKWNFDPREATCEWVIDNLDLVKSFIPRSHPRNVEDSQEFARSSPIYYISVALATVAIVLSFLSMIVTYRRRHQSVMRYAQVEFLSLVLIGLVLVSFGSLMASLHPSNFTCVSVVWLTNLGYTLELVPLMIKMAAVNRLMNAAERMKKVELNRKTLFGIVVVVNVLVCIALVVWTIIDVPKRHVEYGLSSSSSIRDGTNMSEMSITTITKDYYCDSEHNGTLWDSISITWQMLLLICATVLAFQTRNIREEFNETQTLTLMIYSQFVFVILRLITFQLERFIGQAKLVSIRSIIFSLDVIAVLIIYFLPKFLTNQNNQSQRRRSIISMSIETLQNPSSQFRSSQFRNSSLFENSTRKSTGDCSTFKNVDFQIEESHNETTDE